MSISFHYSEMDLKPAL